MISARRRRPAEPAGASPTLATSRVAATTTSWSAHPRSTGVRRRLGTGTGGAAYLIFGSQYVNSSNTVVVQNWLNTTAGPTSGQRSRGRSHPALRPTPDQPRQRQPRSISHSRESHSRRRASTPIRRLARRSRRSSCSSFGILIGAPNAPDANNDAGSAGTGKVFLITGNFLSMNGKTVDVDTPSTTET